jgi:hypothetical protein
LFRITDAAIAARGAPYYDTAHMNPLATGYFLTSAIPVRGDDFFGESGRASVQANGSAVGIAWLATPIGGNQQISGNVRFETANADSNTVNAGANFAVTQAYMQWDQFIFGLSDTAFSDAGCLCNSIDTLGPVGRPTIKNGQPQVGMMFLRPENFASDPTGFYSAVSVEASSPDVDVTTLNATPTFKSHPFDTFSRYPDLVWFLRYENDGMVNDPSTNKLVKIENLHLQFGSVFRDLAIEQATTPQSNTFGWGVQLSGAFFFGKDPCLGRRDGIYFSLTGGRGISHYFNDLHLVAPVDDAVYTDTGTGLSLVPLVAYYAGFTHEWTLTWSSTISFSYIGLDTSSAIPAGSTFTYHEGQALSANLLYHLAQRPPAQNTSQQASRHDLFAGVEASWGQRKNFSGDYGSDDRIMFVLAATK